MNLSPIKRLHIKDKEIIIIGTAHVSQNSAADVEELIKTEDADAVAIELCQGRFEAINDPDKWKKTDIFSLIKQGKTLVLVSQLILGAHQKRIAAKIGIEPGAEMKIALKTAKEKNNTEIALIDRDIKITLRRTWHNMSFWSVSKLLLSSLFSISESEAISAEDIENLKKEDELNAAIREFSRELPQVKKTLIDERDQYMASKLLELDAKKIIAVVGAGHLDGMIRHLESGKEISHTELEQIPPPSFVSKLFAYGIPALIIAVFIYGFIFIDFDTGMRALETWVFATGISAGIGAMIALAHPLSIISAVIAAPIAAIHPGIATGWVSGLVEAWIRSPHVSDFEELADDLQHISGFWKNRVMKILLVVCFSNLGCMIGMWVGSVKLLRNLA